MSVLRSEPFNLVDYDTVVVKLLAFNDIGNSPPSDEGNGAIVPVPPTEPTVPPTALTRDEVSTTKF